MITITLINSYKKKWLQVYNIYQLVCYSSKIMDNNFFCLFYIYFKIIIFYFLTFFLYAFENLANLH